MLMKKINSVKLMSLIGALAFSAVMLITSCNKENVGPGNGNAYVSSSEKDLAVIKEAKQFADKIKKIKIVDDKGRVKGIYNKKTGGFSFADGGEGFNFSSSSGVQWVETAEGGTLYISAGSFGGNAGGGTVQAGTSTLDIGYTFCLSASDSSMNLFGPSFTGVSMVLGIAGDFEAILNGDTTSAETLFTGMAMYIVYADEAAGNYDVVNWIDNIDSTNSNADDFTNKGFAYVMDFTKPALYFSKEGELNVSGGSIGFSGKYLALLVEEDNEDPFDLSGNVEVEEVDGIGVMGCN